MRNDTARAGMPNLGGGDYRPGGRSGTVAARCAAAPGATPIEWPGRHDPARH